MRVGKAKRAHHPSRKPRVVGTAQERLCPPYASLSFPGLFILARRFGGVLNPLQQPQQLCRFLIDGLRRFGEGYHFRHGLVPYSTRPRRVSFLPRDFSVSATSVLCCIRSSP